VPVTLDSYQITVWRTSSLSPKVRIAKYGPRNRRASKPTGSESSAPAAAPTTIDAGQAALTPMSAVT